MTDDGDGDHTVCSLTPAEKRERERLRNARNRIGISNVPPERMKFEHWSANGMACAINRRVDRRRREDA